MACQLDDAALQLLLGEGCMIAPVLEQNAAGRYVYLPEDMLMIRFRSASDYDLVLMDQGDHHIDLALNEFPLFMKKNSPLLLCSGGESSETLDDRHFTVLCRMDRDVAFSLYRDDGLDPDPDPARGLTAVTLDTGLLASSPVPGVAISRILL